jgi:predicted acetyltransferase
VYKSSLSLFLQRLKKVSLYNGFSMAFYIKSAIQEEKQILFAILQPYLDEIMHYPGEDVDYKDRNGLYQYPYLDNYWHEKERFPYLLYKDKDIVGFALVRHTGENWEMAEFYIIPQFRRQGCARTCVTEIFKKHPGEWNISYNKHNQAGRELWKRLAELFSKDHVLTVDENANHEYLRFSV